MRYQIALSATVTILCGWIMFALFAALIPPNSFANRWPDRPLPTVDIGAFRAPAMGRTDLSLWCNVIDRQCVYSEND